jgi:hypothetical protein
VVKGDGGGKQETITFEIIVYETIIGDFAIRVVPTYQSIYLGRRLTSKFISMVFKDLTKLLNYQWMDSLKQ